MSSSLWPLGLQHASLPCPSPTSGACLTSCLLSLWCHPTISSSVVPFSSCLQYFPVSGSFPMSQLFASGGQSIGVQLSHPYMTTGKTIALIRRTFVDKVMSLLFNMLSRLVIAFLPRSKWLLHSWPQSPSTVILEPKQIKYATVSMVSPSICHEVMGPHVMHNLSFLKVFAKHFLHFLNLYLHPLPPTPKSWIIFSIIILNYFSGRLPVSTAFSCFSWILSCSFIWNIILCLFILSNFLWLCFPSCRLQDCSSWFCCLPLVHEAKRLVQAFW